MPSLLHLSAALSPPSPHPAVTPPPPTPRNCSHLYGEFSWPSLDLASLTEKLEDVAEEEARDIEILEQLCSHDDNDHNEADEEHDVVDDFDGELVFAEAVEDRFEEDERRVVEWLNGVIGEEGEGSVDEGRLVEWVDGFEEGVRESLWLVDGRRGVGRRGGAVFSW
ncbi:MAG: hypothetical protein Q9220_006781 [cf. Caloplaca sp. 1 TL-2023]